MWNLLMGIGDADAPPSHLCYPHLPVGLLVLIYKRAQTGTIFFPIFAFPDLMISDFVYSEIKVTKLKFCCLDL